MTWFSAINPHRCVYTVVAYLCLLAAVDEPVAAVTDERRRRFSVDLIVTLPRERIALIRRVNHVELH